MERSAMRPTDDDVNGVVCSPSRDASISLLFRAQYFEILLGGQSSYGLAAFLLFSSENSNLAGKSFFRAK
jgi:hypothetical protein